MAPHSWIIATMEMEMAGPAKNTRLLISRGNTIQKINLFVGGELFVAVLIGTEAF